MSYITRIMKHENTAGCPTNCPYKCNDCYPYDGPLTKPTTHGQWEQIIVVGKPARLAKKIKELEEEVAKLKKANFVLATKKDE